MPRCEKLSLALRSEARGTCRMRFVERGADGLGERPQPKTRGERAIDHGLVGGGHRRVGDP